MYQNSAYPTNMNKRPPMQNPFLNVPMCPQNSWRRPPFPYMRRHIMSESYINVGVRPISHRVNTPMPYKYTPGIKYPVPKQPVEINAAIRQRPQFYMVSANAVGNQNNQHMIPVSNINERKTAVENSALYGNTSILSNSMTNLPTGITPTFIQRPSFYSVPCNIFHSQNNQSIFPVVNISECQSTTLSANQINGQNVSNAFSGLAFHLPATRIGLNYYDTNTGESTWNKNVNGSMSESIEVQQSPIPAEIEQYNKIRIDYPNQNMQDQSFNKNYVNAVYSKNLSMTSKIIMLPTNMCIAPSQNICNAAPLNISKAPPPIYFLPQADITQRNISNCDIQPIMPPPVFQNPVVTHNLSSNIVINECNHNVTQNVLSSNNVTENDFNETHNLLSLNETDHIAQRHKNTLSSSNLIHCNPKNIVNHCKPATQNRYSINGMIESSNKNSSGEISNDSERTTNVICRNDIKKEPLFDSRNAENLNVNALSIPSSSVKGEKDIYKKFEENTIKDRDEKLGEVKNIIIQSIKTDDFSINKTKCISPLNLEKIKQTNKSRPVCSIPVHGTSWCVVWTGDDKVFFYDSQRKLSFWERPAELLNRQDVDKMIEKNPLSIDSNVLPTKVCETSSDSSNVIQKIRKVDQKMPKTNSKEHSISKITSVGENSKNISDDCGILGTNQKSKYDACSHEERIKMFCEMLSEKNVSILSSWEKEINKVIPDPRYLLLTAEERKEVFTDYIKRNLEDEIIKRRRKYQLQKARFLSLLIEAGVTSEFRYTDIAQIFAEDLRFKNFEDMALKESIFNQYVSKLKLDDREKENFENQPKKEISEWLYAKKSFSKNNIELQHNSVKEQHCKSINNNYVKKNILNEYSHEKYEIIPMAKRQKRINNSLENKEDEVKGHFFECPNNDKKVTEDQKHKIAIIQFKELLLDTIKNSDVSWQSAKKILRADERWKFSQDLDPETREQLFTDYTSILKCKKSHLLHQFLDILPNTTLNPSWLNKPRTDLEDARLDRYFFMKENSSTKS